MNVLVACEFSGVVRDAFLKRGHTAVSCDLLPSESPGPHHQGDVLDYIKNTGHWDLMIAHPPCTYLCNSGVRWLVNGYEFPKGIVNNPRYLQMVNAAIFFKLLLDAPINKICIENPIPHKYAVGKIGRKYDQIIQPWWFGEDASKATCLWLKNLPKLIPTRIIEKERYANQTASGQNKLGPSPTRAKERSRTYQGIADAMADQWGIE